jgi:hypothetical protein
MMAPPASMTRSASLRQISADSGDFSVFYENVGVLKRAHATHGHDGRIVDSQALSAGADPL